VAVLRRLIAVLVEVLVRIDPAVWFALDLRRRSAVSWIPVALVLAFFVFAAGECLVAGNLAEGAFLSAIALTFFAVKLRAAAHPQEPYDTGRASGGRR
jgi:hypothetical protein